MTNSPDNNKEVIKVEDAWLCFKIRRARKKMIKQIILSPFGKKDRVEEFWALKPKELWNAPIVKRFASQLANMRGMSELDVRIYREDSLHIDIFDDEQREIFMTSDDVELLRGLSKENLTRYLERWSA